MSFIFAWTSPIVHVYFVSQISSRVLATANLLTVGLSAIVNYTVQVDKIKDWYKENFFWIVISDVVIFMTASILGVHCPEIRFLGFAFINAVSTVLWVMVMRNCANNIIIDGDERTKFDSLNNAFCNGASFIGGILAIVFIDMSIETCVIMQCFANAFMGATDLYSFSKLQAKLNVKK